MDTTGRPSWMAPPAASPAAAPAAPAASARPPLTLVAAVVGVVALAAVEVALVVGRDDLVVGRRALVVVVIVGQLVLAALTLRRSSAGAMLLGLCLLSGAAGAAGAGEWAVVVGAVAVLALLAASLHWFPGYQP